MGTTDDTTNSRQPGNQIEPNVSAETPPGSSDPSAESPLPARSAWEQAIEAERVQLLQARSVIACLYEVLLHADGEEAVAYAETAYVAGKIIEESVDRLDLVRLKPLVEAAGQGRGSQQPMPDDLRFGPYSVREESVPYLC